VSSHVHEEPEDLSSDNRQPSISITLKILQISMAPSSPLCTGEGRHGAEVAGGEEDEDEPNPVGVSMSDSEEDKNPRAIIDDAELFEEDFTDASEDEVEMIPELVEEQKKLEEELRIDENTKATMKMNISEELARSNYEAAGTLVDEEPERILLEEYKHLMDEEVDQVFSQVLAEGKVKYEPVDFQRISVNILAQQKTLILISPTGSGKMNIPLWVVLVLQKLLPKRCFQSMYELRRFRCN